MQATNHFYWKSVDKFLELKKKKKKKNKTSALDKFEIISFCFLKCKSIREKISEEGAVTITHFMEIS